MIYAVQLGDNGPIKFGYASNVYKRMAQMQVSHHEVLHLRACEEVGDDLKAERMIHENLAQYRIRGEWFRPTEPVLEVVSHMQSGLGEAMEILKRCAAHEAHVRADKDRLALKAFLGIVRKLKERMDGRAQRPATQKA
jgi:hypothetical protein